MKTFLTASLFSLAVLSGANAEAPTNASAQFIGCVEAGALYRTVGGSIVLERADPTCSWKTSAAAQQRETH